MYFINNYNSKSGNFISFYLVGYSKNFKLKMVLLSHPTLISIQINAFLQQNNNNNNNTLHCIIFFSVFQQNLLVYIVCKKPLFLGIDFHNLFNEKIT